MFVLYKLIPEPVELQSYVMDKSIQNFEFFITERNRKYQHLFLSCQGNLYDDSEFSVGIHALLLSTYPFKFEEKKPQTVLLFLGLKGRHKQCRLGQ